MLERLQIRLEELSRIGERALPRAAARIQAKLRTDATTQRGNVPGYGDMGGPIEARSDAEAVVVRAPGWVIDKARDLGQPDAWREILADEVARATEES